jgi:TolB-like protein
MKSNFLHRLGTAFLAAGALLMPSCASAEGNVVYIHPLADFSLIQRVGVLPLENISTDPSAGEWVRQVLTNELLAQGLFDVVEPWEMNRAVLEKNLSEVGTLSKEQMRELAGVVEAQALMVGSVLQFNRGRTGNVSSPEVALSLRMIDVETGLVIWSTTYSISGVSLGNKLTGTDGPDLTAATSLLCRDLLSTFSG